MKWNEVKAAMSAPLVCKILVYKKSLKQKSMFYSIPSACCQPLTPEIAPQWLCVKMSHALLCNGARCVSVIGQGQYSLSAHATQNGLIHYWFMPSPPVYSSLFHTTIEEKMEKKFNDLNNDVTFNQTCASGWERLACKEIIAAKLQHNVCFHKCCQQGYRVKGGARDNVCVDSIRLPWHLLKSILFFFTQNTAEFLFHVRKIFEMGRWINFLMDDSIHIVISCWNATS